MKSLHNINYAMLFESMHPDFWQQEEIRSMPEGLVFTEMLLPLDREYVRASGWTEAEFEFGLFSGAIEELRQTVGRVDEKWPEFFNVGDRIFCAYSDGKPVSFCIIEDMGIYAGVRIGGPGCVGTLPEYRRRGIGLELVRRVTGILQEEGFDYSYIHYTSVPDWYAKLGYVPVLKWNSRGMIPTDHWS